MIIKTSNKRDLILSFFLTFPTKEFSLRELSRETGVSFPWTRLIVEELSKQDLVLRKKKSNLVLVKSNIDSHLFKVLKRAHNFITIHQCGLVEFLIDYFMRPEVMVLFGSFEKGEDFENSDIDIALITLRKKIPNIEKYEKFLTKKVSIKTFSRSEIEKDFWNTLANGTILSGYLKLP